MKNSVGVFTNRLENIESSISEIQSQYKYDDFVIFNDFFFDCNELSKKYSIFSSFYMKFFQGTVIFIDEHDYLKYKDNILGKTVLWKKL